MASSACRFPFPSPHPLHIAGSPVPVQAMRLNPSDEMKLYQPWLRFEREILHRQMAGLPGKAPHAPKRAADFPRNQPPSSQHFSVPNFIQPPQWERRTPSPPAPVITAPLQIPSAAVPDGTVCPQSPCSRWPWPFQTYPCTPKMKPSQYGHPDVFSK